MLLATSASVSAGDTPQLVRSAQHGDPANFALLFDRHSAGMLAVAHRLLGSGPDAEDACQESAITEARKHLIASHWGWWGGADSDEGTAEGLLARGATQISDMLRHRHPPPPLPAPGVSPHGAAARLTPRSDGSAVTRAASTCSYGK
ncbi:RNA polymerase sigma factor [Micromonospora sp. DT4]|uniref:RNA polymerase sigma factor n=1 Tax=Micromonospora sp. DT4 TaxID=3393438 RepID=UPI003CFAFD4F